MSAPQGLPARKAALAILSQVLRQRRPLDVAFEAILPPAGLDARDAGFARAIVSETLRRLGQLDDLIRHFVPKPPPPHKAGPALEILMAGACELLFLDVAAHGAVDGANRLALADDKAKHFKPLINAVLRRVSQEGRAIVAGQDAARLNTPDWLWLRWCDAYGAQEAGAMAAMHAQTPPLDLVLKSAAPADVPDIDGAQMLPGGVMRLRNAARIEALPGFAEGAWWVQDYAATLPVRLFGDVAGVRVLDLCAAPGGKTAELATRGARVTAVEREGERMARLQENLARLGLDAETVVSDLRDYTPGELFGCVLLDAPCSATGTIRRHPELPWIKSAADVTLCAGAAEELLDAASLMVAPGGLLVFAVCSLEREEGEDQIAAFLARNDGRNDGRKGSFARVPVTADEIFGLGAAISAEGDLRTRPSLFAEQGGMDGFYAARLRRLA